MEPQKIQSEKEKNSRDKLYLTVIILLIVGCAILTWQLMERSGQLTTANADIAELNTSLEELMGIMGGDVTKESMKTELEAMLQQMEVLETSNTDFQDSLVAQRERILGLIADVEHWEGQAAGKYKLQKELDQIRAINKDLYRTIDSLNTLNDNLIAELDYTHEVLTDVEGQRDQLSQDLNTSIGLVEAGSKLQALNMVGEGIRVKSSGEVTDTDRASRTEQIRICFTIAANPITKPGPKNIYMRVISPEGSVISNGATEAYMFDTETGQALYSEKREINYQNEPLELCIFYKLPEEIFEGDYIVQLYADGVKIGTTDFYLKK